ncbi:urinary protein 1-like [Lepidochelys kempii]|uniref:urinary protein 1-like n=1 Tax=Lepidochelys kempii TaxID=8472 RepID=UPI003C705AE1
MALSSPGSQSTSFAAQAQLLTRLTRPHSSSLGLAERKLKMKKILALGLPALLCLATADPLQCNGCFKLLQDGTCKISQYTCTAAPGESCFTRKITSESQILRVERGCTAICDDLVFNYYDYKETTQCCTDRPFCNVHNPWPQIPK